MKCYEKAMHDYATLYIKYDLIIMNIMEKVYEKLCYVRNVMKRFLSKSMRGGLKNVILCLPERK